MLAAAAIGNSLETWYEAEQLVSHLGQVMSWVSCCNSWDLSWVSSHYGWCLKWRITVTRSYLLSVSTRNLYVILASISGALNEQSWDDWWLFLYFVSNQLSYWYSTTGTPGTVAPVTGAPGTGLPCTGSPGARTLGLGLGLMPSARHSSSRRTSSTRPLYHHRGYV